MYTFCHLNFLHPPLLTGDLLLQRIQFMAANRPTTFCNSGMFVGEMSGNKLPSDMTKLMSQKRLSGSDYSQRVILKTYIGEMTVDERFIGEMSVDDMSFGECLSAAYRSGNFCRWISYRKKKYQKVSVEKYLWRFCLSANVCLWNVRRRILPPKICWRNFYLQTPVGNFSVRKRLSTNIFPGKCTIYDSLEPQVFIKFISWHFEFLA